MNSIKQSYDFFQTQLLPAISLKHKRLFTFGFRALTLQPFTSLNGNARTVVSNRSTAESKIYRLVSNSCFLSYFPQMVSSLGLVTPHDKVNVDFSTFAGFYVLTFAKQTHLGRAIPLYFAVLEYPLVSEGSQNWFIINHMEKFIASLGFSPFFVFDRGFEIPLLVKYLTQKNIPFTIRIRKDKFVYFEGRDQPLRNLPWYEKDCLVKIYGKKLRIVVSEKLSERKDSKGNEEPWYLLTSDMVSSKEKITSSYYFRFEIEETFKDLKHINRLKQFFPIEKPQTFCILLWFYTLFIWLSFLLKEMEQYLLKRIKQKRRKRLSVVRFFFEEIQRMKNTLLWREIAM